MGNGGPLGNRVGQSPAENPVGLRLRVPFRRCRLQLYSELFTAATLVISLIVSQSIDTYFTPIMVEVPGTAPGSGLALRFGQQLQALFI